MDNYRKEVDRFKNKIEQLAPIASKEWKKEKELHDLKNELAALDRKIQMELAPKEERPETSEEKEANEKEISISLHQNNDAEDEPKKLKGVKM
jgi:hypothetical protein